MVMEIRFIERNRIQYVHSSQSVRDHSIFVRYKYISKDLKNQNHKT